MKVSVYALMGVLLCSSQMAYADEVSYPHLEGEVAVEIQNDWIFNSDDPDEEANTLFTKTEPHFVLSFNENLALEAGLVFEPVRDPDAGDDSYFYGQGLFAEEFKLTYTTDDFGLYAGKFNPNFGTAFEQGLSIYGNDFAEDYELTERIGFGGFVPLPVEGFGEHTLSANVFFADTTFLSNSVITKRGRVSKNDGGISNTEDLSSFSVALDSEDIGNFKGLNTHIAYRRQSPGDVDTGLDHENGYVIGVDYITELSDDVEGHALVEWARIDNVDGSTDNVDYLTSTVDLTILGNWTVAADYTLRNFDVATGDDVHDYIAELTGGYYFDNGVGINLGYVKAREDSVDRQGLGLLLTYEYEF
ncbi:MAG TPA: hypothetical protein PKI93_05015 [Alphaproteobacteria bacterium]|nr:hypothetical protein [Alphaproteobacteria bacterium]HNS45031.1 hypothetical protein [Alphaproteobacteria bacterium]